MTTNAIMLGRWKKRLLSLTLKGCDASATVSEKPSEKYREQPPELHTN